MNCEQAAQLLPDYLQGSLSHDEADRIEQHMEHCIQCREVVAIWTELSRLPQDQPSPASRSRFAAMLEAYQLGRSEKGGLPSWGRKVLLGWNASNWLRSPVGGLAAALALLVIGFFAGSRMNRSESHSEELTAMHSELRNMRQLVVLSLLEQQSANERLQGVTWSAGEEQPDQKVLSALVHTLRYDSSVDVRLAALDALSRHGNQPQVRKGLLEALQAQQSPLVQVALIDLLVELRDVNAVEQLQRFQRDPSLDPAVRQRAEWAIRKLS